MTVFKNPLNMLHFPDFKRRPVLKFISKRSGPFDGKVKLTRDRVYIVPTKAGLIFSLLLLTLLLGSINYEKNLGFVLTFLLCGAGNAILLSTWRNIAGLELLSRQAPPVFAGETATFNIQLINHKLLDRYAIAISHDGTEHDLVDCPVNSSKQIQFKVKTGKRGRLNPGRFRLYTEFPTGLFTAWTWIDLSMSCIVYPSPDRYTAAPDHEQSETGDNDHSGHGMENFSHLRKYQQGDNLNRISWKATAKTDEIFSKEFIGAQPVKHWIIWDQIPARDNEHRLSVMSALIIDAEKNNRQYGIKLAEKQLQPGSGNKHFHQCMTMLALH